MPTLIPSQNQNIEKWGAIALTGRDITGDLKVLTDTTIKGLMRSLGDVGATPTTPGTGKTLIKVLEDISSSSGITGDITKWGGTSVTGRDISGDFQALTDDSIKGLMRSIGDPGVAPTDATGKTLLKLLTDILAVDFATESGGNLATLAGKDFATQTTLDTLFKPSDLRGSSPTYGTVSVANTATQIKASNSSRKSIFIQNLGSDNMYVGNDASVTTANGGAKIVPGAAMELIYCTSAIYGISDGGNIDTRYFEVA